MDKPPYKIGLVAGAKGPNDQQFEWMRSEIKRRIHDLGGAHVLLIPARNLGNPPSWIHRRPRPEGTTIIKDDLPNWLTGFQGPSSVVNKLQGLGVDEVWCFAGEGQTAFGASVGSRVYQHAITTLTKISDAARYKLVVSWVTPAAVLTDKDSLTGKPAKHNRKGVRAPWTNN